MHRQDCAALLLIHPGTREGAGVFFSGLRSGGMRHGTVIFATLAGVPRRRLWARLDLDWQLADIPPQFPWDA